MNLSTALNKRICLVSVVLILALSFTGCEKKYTTVKDDITSGEGQSGYLTVDSFTLKEPSNEEKAPLESCAVLIPAGFKKSDSVEGMYVSEMYPMESSNIFYTITDPSEIGAVSDKLDQNSYKKAVEEAYISLGESVSLTVDSFEKGSMQDVPCYKIRSHYNAGEFDVQQLTYIIIATNTHVITYSQAGDDELMYDFLEAEGEIKLIRNTLK
ncbi:MAG: hypothetical protein K6A38_04625 [Lachnospiraceae bacterium]|nr:hypothetical protein [Lachnospiraceae bacterium]